MRWCVMKTFSLAVIVVMLNTKPKQKKHGVKREKMEIIDACPFLLEH